MTSMKRPIDGGESSDLDAHVPHGSLDAFPVARDSSSLGAFGGALTRFFWRPVVILPLLFALARMVLALHIPLTPNAGALYDDQLFVSMAASLVEGSWLGPFTPFLFVKNPGLGLWFAFVFWSGLPEQFWLCALHIGGLVFFLCAIRPAVASEWTRAAIFCLMLYGPDLLSWAAVGRVYRFGIVVPLTIWMVSGYLALWLRSRDSRALCASRESQSSRDVVGARLRWMVPSGCAWALLWLIREDALWTVPFALVATLLTFVYAQRDERKQLVLPFAVAPCIVLGAVELVCLANFVAYGVWQTNDRSTGSFGSVSAALLAIDDGSFSHDPEIWITRKALEEAFLASPTLDELETAFWRTFEAGGREGETGDHPLWAFRIAYDEVFPQSDARTFATYWNTVANELEAAFDAGALKKETGRIALSNNVKPLVVSEIPALLGESVLWCGRLAFGRLADHDLYGPVGRGGEGSLFEQRRAEVLLGRSLLVDPQTKDGDTTDLTVQDDAALEDPQNALAAPYLRLASAIVGLWRVLLPVVTIASFGSLVGLVVAAFRGDAMSARVLVSVLGLALSAWSVVMITLLFSQWMLAGGAQSVFITYGLSFYPLYGMACALLIGRASQIGIDRFDRTHGHNFEKIQKVRVGRARKRVRERFSESVRTRMRTNFGQRFLRRSNDRSFEKKRGYSR